MTATATTSKKPVRKFRQKRKVKGKGKAPKQPAERPLQASDVLDPSHPLHGTFRKWVEKRDEVTCGNVIKGTGKFNQCADGEQLTRRKARKFLAAYPQYRAVMVKVVPVEKAA